MLYISQRSGRPCASSVLQEQLANLACVRQYVEPVLDILSTTENCELIHRAVKEECAVNELGQYCAL